MTTNPHQNMPDLVSTYLARREGQVSSGTLSNQRHMLVRFATWWDTQRPKRIPRNMTTDDLERYVWGKHKCIKGCRPGGRFHVGAGLRDSMSPGAFNNQVGVLRLFLTWAGHRGHMPTELLDVVSHGAKVTKRRKLRLSVSQMMELVEEAPDPWTRIVVALAAFTAGRSSELLSLTVGDVNLAAGLIEWERHKTRDDADSLPITSDLARELDRWFAAYSEHLGRAVYGSDYLIPRRTWHHAGYFVYHPDQRRGDNLHKVIKPELARVLDCPIEDLEQQGVHTLRRSMALALYERLRAENHGDPVGVVQALLGHAQRGMTEAYIGLESGRQERDNLLRGKSMFG